MAPPKAIELVVLIGIVVGVLVVVAPGSSVSPGAVGAGEDVVGSGEMEVGVAEGCDVVVADPEEVVVGSLSGRLVVGVGSLNTSIVTDPQVNPPASRS